MLQLEFILFFVITNISGMVAQTIPEISFPKEKDGVIKLNTFGEIDSNKNKIDYELLSVFVAHHTDLQTYCCPIQGNFIKKDNILIFKPYFPFEQGLFYTVRFKRKNSKLFSYYSFRIEEQENIPEAKILSIFPTTNLVPQNMLRFYIYFNTPMKKGEALEHIKLLDQNNNEDKKAFMQFKQELWSADGKRLTLLLDPGRIKRAVSTNLEYGPVLKKDNKYYLNISKKWKDIHEQNLPQETVKELTVIEPYRNKMDVTKWVLYKPKSHSHDMLQIHFDRIMDHALFQSMIRIINQKNNPVKGNWFVEENENIIKFIPKDKWSKGNYKVIFDTQIEDIAGNNLQNLLDHKITNTNNFEKNKIIEFKL